jgi:hypothetical protein
VEIQKILQEEIKKKKPLKKGFFYGVSLRDSRLFSLVSLRVALSAVSFPLRSKGRRCNR